MMAPRVPADKLAQVRALTSPLQDSPEIVEQDKVLYNGKGTCVNCHGKDGSGNGPGAAKLEPSPRDFRHHGFWRHRTEGELFWVIKYGSPGTAMLGFGQVLSDEEVWTIIRYVRTFAGEHGQGMMSQGEGGRPRRGPGDGMSVREHRRPKSGMGSCEGEACGR